MTLIKDHAVVFRFDDGDPWTLWGTYDTAEDAQRLAAILNEETGSREHRAARLTVTFDDEPTLAAATLSATDSTAHHTILIGEDGNRVDDAAEAARIDCTCGNPDCENVSP